MDQLKSLGSKVKSEAAQDHPPPAVKRSVKVSIHTSVSVNIESYCCVYCSLTQESPVMLEYISTVHVIRNFMYKSLEVKVHVQIGAVL